MFMFGLLLWELFNRENWNGAQSMGMELDEYRSGLKSGETQARLMSYLVDEIPALMRELIERCLRSDPTARLNFFL